MNMTVTFNGLPRLLINFNQGDMPKGEARETVAQDAIRQGEMQVSGSVRARLFALQAAVAELPEVECPLQHVFAPGAYARTIRVPKGTVVVGKIHKHKHLNILSQGEVLILTESGGEQRMKGPLTMVSEAGTKRAVYALTDVVWTTIHLTNETDLAKIEAEVIAKDFSEYEQFLCEVTV